jgi:ABC-type polar amino acid transport system ATPase subunit
MSTSEANAPMSDAAMIELIHVKKSFGAVSVLKDISLRVPRGGVVALIGPSGSGKSTLLRCLNLLTLPESGVIRVGRSTMDFTNGHQLPRDKDLAAFRARTGMVFQNFNLFPHMSVIRNVMEGPVTVLKVRPDEARQTALALFGQGRIARQGRRCPGQAVRRPEAARRDRPCAGDEAGGDVVRRSDVGARS